MYVMCALTLTLAQSPAEMIGFFFACYIVHACSDNKRDLCTQQITITSNLNPIKYTVKQQKPRAICGKPVHLDAVHTDHQQRSLKAKDQWLNLCRTERIKGCERVRFNK